MAKRFTDTDKWKDSWFRSLDLKAKLAWIFLCDECDHCGIWAMDWDVASLRLGFKIDLQFLIKNFENRIYVFKDRVLIVKFFQFQYGFREGSWKAKESASKRLLSLGFSFPLPFGADGQNKDLGKSWVSLRQDLGKSYTNTNTNTNTNTGEPDAKRNKIGSDGFDFDAIYASYPNKVGKKLGLKSCMNQIKTKEQYERLQLAVKNYSDRCVAHQTEKKYIKHFSTFMNCWEEWVDITTHSTQPEIKKLPTLSW